MHRTEIDRLLVKTAHGDNAAFEELYIKTRRGVYAFLYTYLHQNADTEDAMQTVYLKIKQNISSYRAGTNGSAWILQIAKNHALNELQKRKKTIAIDEVNERVFAVSAPETSSVTEAMERVLSEEEQQIVTLHVLWSYKHREIAQIMELPTGTVTSKYKRAIEKLQKYLKEEEA